jgi:class 3 adenylate cyclase/tetratricopeptide (TPR) repeat protein
MKKRTTDLTDTTALKSQTSYIEQQFLRFPEKFGLKELRMIWNERAYDVSVPPLLLESLADQLLKRGEPLLANEVLDKGLEYQPSHRRFRQLAGLALARCGATVQANRLLQGLHAEGDDSEETLGLLARTHKDLGLMHAEACPEHCRGGGERRNELERALGFYRESFEKHENAYWTGINAATLSCLLDQDAAAVALARRVAETCETRLADGKVTRSEKYWLYATLGECSLITREPAKAQKWYKKAFAVIQGRWGDLASTKRNARLLVNKLGLDPDLPAVCFPVPPVAVFSGHMIDRPDRARPRFPEAVANAVKKALKKILIGHHPGFSYSSAACGGDILFLESVQELGGEINLVLPFEADRFVDSSVAFFPGSPWLERFRTAMGNAHSISIASEESSGNDGTIFEFSNLLMTGKAIERALRLETRVVPIAVWDGSPGDGRGGTAGLVEHWRAHGYQVEVVDPRDFYDDGLVVCSGGTPPSGLPTAAGKPSIELCPAIKAILFADAVHFSRLREIQFPAFISDFLALIGQTLEKSGRSIIMKNTWGDGLFFVFDDIREAGTLALILADQLNASKWLAKGLPESLNLRIALHAGPVLPFLDPVTGRRNFLGSHVNRAARIEPITPPGQVYASESFMALAVAEGNTDFSFEYVGKVPLAKSFGTFPLYHLRPSLR